MNNNRKIIGYNTQTGEPIYESNRNFSNYQPQSLNNNQPNTSMPPKRSNKIPIIVTIAIVLVLSLVYVINLNDSQVFTNKNKDTNRTVMIYIVGSNLESSYGAATMDINEILSANPDLTDNNIVIYTGGSRKWYGEFENNATYELTESGFQLVKKDNAVSMGSSETLTNFLNYVTSNYKSDEYSLILWNHGGGPIYGYGSDEIYFDDGLLLKEIKQALNDSSFSSNNKLEFIGFDACLMASVEVADALKDYAKYMIASQETEEGYGWDYRFFEKVNGDTSTLELGKLIIDYNYNFYQSSDNARVTLSMIDLSKISLLEEDINDLFSDVDITLSNDGYSKIVSQITKAKSFGYNGYENSFDLLDLSEISNQLKDDYPEETKAMNSAIEQVVVYQKNNLDGANGISIYYPYYSKKSLSTSMKRYEELDFAQDYTKFLNNYVKILTGEGMFNLNLAITPLNPQLSDDKTISVDLNEELINNYNNAKYIIFKDMQDGNYIPVYESSEVTLKDNGTLLANYQKLELSITDSNNQLSSATITEYERNNNSTTYNMEVTLTKEDNTTTNANLRLLVDSANPSGKVIGVTSITSIGNPNALRKVINLEDYQKITFNSTSYKLFTSTGEYQEDWGNTQRQYTSSIKTDESYKIELTKLNNKYNYYCMFKIYDTQGNEYKTNFVKIS